MPSHLENRDILIDNLRRELFGPDPAGLHIDVEAPLLFENAAAAFGPYRQMGSGEEMLTRDSPTKRYGVGVLFPLRIENREDKQSPDAAESQDLDLATDGMIDNAAQTDEPTPQISDSEPELGLEGESDDFDLSMANTYQPSSLGVSFLADLPEGGALLVSATGGRYEPKDVAYQRSGEHDDASQPPAQVEIQGKELRRRTWWLRRSVTYTACVPAALLTTSSVTRWSVRSSANASGIEVTSSNADGLDLRIEIFSRPHTSGARLLTVCLVNRTPSRPEQGYNRYCLFQSRFEATIQGSDSGSSIRPYPETHPVGDPEVETQALLYRKTQTFATGHGCAADWTKSTVPERASSVIAECLPEVETPSVTPDIGRDDGTPVEVDMAALAGLVPDNDGFSSMAEVIALYRRWIDFRQLESAELDQNYRQAADRNLTDCRRAADRMQRGLEYLHRSPNALLAFKLANRAVLMQQISSNAPTRRANWDTNTDELSFDRAYVDPEEWSIPKGRGKWRAFQIAFLLTALASTGERDDVERATVELIWFPTGGGKTEAYLGLAAFACFKRRLDDPADAGVNAIMRYTLRLLTAQQFQRAASLVCAMEYIRQTRADNDLGSEPFSIGIWVGGDTTPNRHDTAVQALGRMERYARGNNPFLLGRCPWCSVEFKRIELPRKGTGERRGRVLGYARADGTVVARCPEASCLFHPSLPVYVIDQAIYEKRPTLVIGTIDKFAVLAWRPEARALFGLGKDGDREFSPPGLILQDELHLISGPLGSLAGLYEAVIEELCVDHRGSDPALPKIVTATATIRRYERQIHDLYAREAVSLFPPPGLDADDSFFARYDQKAAGRKFLGVHAVSLGSVQTEWVRALTSLFQSPKLLPEEERDPWWTLLVFFNSLREMGTAHTLFQSDIPDYLQVLWKRKGIAYEDRRYVRRMFELTGGLPSEEIAQAIGALDTPYKNSREVAVDVCLASNIIEVGIDIQRLALMVVAGQPKTTSQYIQVTGRVGRRRGEPGLIVTLFSPSKPRDRSHFERFRSYHERLYANVEPTSVTPFSAPALDRALHATLVAFARLTGGPELADCPYPFPQELVERFRVIVERRAETVDSDERATVLRTYDRRAKEWTASKRNSWERRGDDAGLIRRYGEYATPEEVALSWPTPTSMRNVDAECQAEITTLYLRAGGDDA